MLLNFLLINFLFWQVTRSIGDDDLKPAVTAKPEITETILSVEDEYLVRSIDLIICCYMWFINCVDFQSTILVQKINEQCYAKLMY